MFTRLYIEALLVDAGPADRIWELWNAGVITDACMGWWFVAKSG